MMLLGSAIGRTNYADGCLELRYTFNKTLEFADPLLRSESEVFKCERQIYSELNCARSRRTGWWIEEIVFDIGAHGAVSIPLSLPEAC